MFIQINNDLFESLFEMKFFQIFYKRWYTYVSIFNFNVNFISPWGRGKNILKNSEFIVKIFYQRSVLCIDVQNWFMLVIFYLF